VFVSAHSVWRNFYFPQTVRAPPFEEVDQDGSGAIDKGEFRQMLRELNLSYR